MGSVCRSRVCKAWIVGRRGLHCVGHQSYPERTTLYQGHSRLNPERTTLLQGHSRLNPERTTLLQGHSRLNPERTTLLQGHSRLNPESCEWTTSCVRCLQLRFIHSPKKNLGDLKRKYELERLRLKMYKFYDHKDPRLLMVFCRPDYSEFRVSAFLHGYSAFSALVLEQQPEHKDQSWMLKNLRPSLHGRVLVEHSPKALNVYDSQLTPALWKKAALKLAPRRKTSEITAVDVKLVACLQTSASYHRFLLQLISDMSRAEHIYHLGHVACFCFVPPRELKGIVFKAGGSYDHGKNHKLFEVGGSLRKVLYKIFFQITRVAEVSTSFLSNLKAKDLKNRLGDGYSRNMVLLHLVPAPGLQELGPLGSLTNLLILLQLLKEHRSDTVLSTIERISSGTTEALQAKGFKKHHLVNYLTRDDIFTIHKVLLDQPKYFTTFLCELEDDDDRDDGGDDRDDGGDDGGDDRDDDGGGDTEHSGRACGHKAISL